MVQQADRRKHDDRDQGGAYCRETPVRRPLLRGPGDGAAGGFGFVELGGRLRVVLGTDRRVVLGQQRNRIEAHKPGEGPDVPAGVEVTAAQ